MTTRPVNTEASAAARPPITQAARPGTRPLPTQPSKAGGANARSTAPKAGAHQPSDNTPKLKADLALAVQRMNAHMPTGTVAPAALTSASVAQASTGGASSTARLTPRDIKAFRDVYHRAPKSVIDRQMATALNPSNPTGRAAGHDSVIRAAHFKPQPGKGMVKVALFIPQHKVLNPSPHHVGSKYDYGDDRGFRPDFKPGQARVTLYIDYNSGVMVARQNPSVSTNGHIKAGPPVVDAWINRQGSLHIHYNAKDPFAPPGASLKHTANGDLYLMNSGRATPNLSGRIGKFPAIEAYHVSNNGHVGTMLQQDAADKSTRGPITGLPFHRKVGNPDKDQTEFYHWENTPDQGQKWVENARAQLGYPDSAPSIHMPPAMHRV